MHGIDAKHLRELVIKPTLKALDPEIPYSDVAVELLVLTAATESHMGRWLRQNDGGGNPTGVALGIYQMEPGTHDDIWDRFIYYQSKLYNKLDLLTYRGSADELVTNLAYATAMARVHYWRHPSPLPTTMDPTLLAIAWKKMWNTTSGKGTVEKAVADYRRYAVG